MTFQRNYLKGWAGLSADQIKSVVFLFFATLYQTDNKVFDHGVDVIDLLR